MATSLFNGIVYLLVCVFSWFAYSLDLFDRSKMVRESFHCRLVIKTEQIFSVFLICHRFSASHLKAVENKPLIWEPCWPLTDVEIFVKLRVPQKIVSSLCNCCGGARTLTVPVSTQLHRVCFNLQFEALFESI